MSEDELMEGFDTGEFSLDDIPEVHLIPDGTEIELRLCDAVAKKSGAGAGYLQIHLDAVSDDLAKDLYEPIFLPRPDSTKKQNAGSLNRIKNIVDAFGGQGSGSWTVAKLLATLKTLKGNRCYCLVIQVQPNKEYPPNNQVKRFGSSRSIPF